MVFMAVLQVLQTTPRRLLDARRIAVVRRAEKDA